MRSLPHPSREQLDLAAILEALGDPTRLKLFLQADEMCEARCGSFSAHGSKTNLSYHFQRLREAGIFQVRIEGTNRFISLRREDLEARFPGLIDSLLTAARASATAPVEDAVPVEA
jgi:DNA-binding transcriptional ArsR family regulator